MSTSPYRLSLTAAQLEELLLSIGDKLSVNNIQYTYNYTGPDDPLKVAAASAVRNMWIRLNEMVTGEGLKAAINAADDSNVFTDADKEKLSRDFFKFVGSPADSLARDEINTSSFEGGEVILLQKNSAGNPEFQYWKKTVYVDPDTPPTFAWTTVTGSQDNDVTFPIVGTSLVKKIPKTLFHMVEFRLHAYTPSDGHWQSVSGKVGWQGADLYFSLSDEAKTADIIQYNFSIDTNNVNINAVTLVPNVKVYCSIIRGY